MPKTLLCWVFYKFRTNNSCKKFIISESVVSKRADQLPNVIGNDGYTESSDLLMGKRNHNFIIFKHITTKYRFYVPPRQLVSPPCLSIRYP